MKILILQLARLGDIYQTWPVLRAIKRTHPDAQVHFLTRSKFASAAPADGAIDRLWALDTRDVLTPLIDEKPDIENALAKLDKTIRELKAENFDKVINLSFSPFSSFLVKEISGLMTEVKGYTRQNDGYLSIPDDGSAYFYAQVGNGRPNRLHVTDIFAFVSDVELTEADWEPTQRDETIAQSLVVRQAGDRSIVIHVGASDPGKTLSWAKWMQVARGLLAAQEGNVVLVGSNAEREVAERICSGLTDRAAVNLVGQTNLNELFEIIRGSSLLIGGDSAPIHIAGLVGTPVLNISFPMVSFWETGPRSARSRIMPIAGEDQVSPEMIVDEAKGILAGKSTLYPAVRVSGPTYPYVETRPQPGAHAWQLLKAIYMSADFPEAPDELYMIGVARLADVTKLGREQLATLRANPANTTASAILDRVAEVIDRIQDMVPELSPLVRWFKTELLRIGPMSVAELVETTDSVYRRLGEVLALYEPAPETQDPKEVGNDDASMG